MSSSLQSKLPDDALAARVRREDEIAKKTPAKNGTVKKDAGISVIERGWAFYLEGYRWAATDDGEDGVHRWLWRRSKIK